MDVIGAKWAKEHLECTLPRKEFIENYAKEKSLEVSIKPNASVATTMALVFMDYFANKAGMKFELLKVNKFFNTKCKPPLISYTYN